MPKQVTTLIPLLCELCPKKPRFSDVSHLLTHISSKSHLSNRFKLQIRSQGEPEARRLLEDFDSWYNDNGLEDLLSERLTAKEQKKTTKRIRLPSAPTKSKVKIEMKVADHMDRPLAATPIYHPPIPRMHLWSTDPYVADFTVPPTGSPWNLNSIYETPTMKRSIPNFPRNQSPTPSSTKPGNSTPWKPDDTEDEAEKDGSKLKGVYWPGMDLFDSATAEMKRMRNQKKDGTALQQMKRSSARIEPTEWVFNADGEFRKARDIFDESTDSSPEKSVVAPTPKKRRTQKGALTETSLNAPRLRPSIARQPVRKAVTTRRLTTVDLAEVAPKKTKHSNRPKVLTNPQFSPSVEEHEEFRLTMGELGKKRQLSVFHDADQESPARTESPLEEHRFEFSAGRTVIPSKSRHVRQSSPAPLFKPIPMHFGGKENLGPGQMNQRLMSTTAGGFHPDIFQSDSLNPLYTHSHAHAFSYGERQSFQTDFKPGFSGFSGDFKPLMMIDSFRGINEPHGLSNVAGSGMADDMRYGA